MIAETDAQEARWPPTFSPSRLSRRWLALWIVQAESQRTLRSIASRVAISVASASPR
jgi:hypothetical protein